MKIYVNANFEYLLDGATDRQKIWLAFWSHIYTKHNCSTWMNLHPKDYQFMLGLEECKYEMNAFGSTARPADNPTAIRHLGEAIAAEFAWRNENRHNVLWRSRTLAETNSKKYAPKPKTETEITDPKAINMWCYLLGRMTADNLITGFRWRDQGLWTINDLVLDEMGQKPL